MKIANDYKNIILNAENLIENRNILLIFLSLTLLDIASYCNYNYGVSAIPTIKTSDIPATIFVTLSIIIFHINIIKPILDLFISMAIIKLNIANQQTYDKNDHFVSIHSIKEYAVFSGDRVSYEIFSHEKAALDREVDRLKSASKISFLLLSSILIELVITIFDKSNTHMIIQLLIPNKECSTFTLYITSFIFPFFIAFSAFPWIKENATITYDRRIYSPELSFKIHESKILDRRFLPNTRDK